MEQKFRREIVWRYALLVILAMLFVLAMPGGSHADMGPKPTMTFTLTYQISPAPAVTGGELLECSTADCADAQPLPEAGPQHFSCQTDTCDSMAYGYEPYHRLRLHFADGSTRESNVFGKKYFNARYTVTVAETDLTVTETRGTGNAMGWLVFGTIAGSCLAAMLAVAVLVILVMLILKARKTRVTFASAKWWLLAIWLVGIPFVAVGGYFSAGVPLSIALEMVIAAGFALWNKESAGRLLSVVLLANIITLPGLWLVLNSAGSGAYLPLLLVGEVIVWAVEAAIFAAVLRPDFSWHRAVLFSLLLNVASLLLGLFLPV